MLAQRLKTDLFVEELKRINLQSKHKNIPKIAFLSHIGYIVYYIAYGEKMGIIQSKKPNNFITLGNISQNYKIQFK